MVFGIKFRITYLLNFKDYNLSDWEQEFLVSVLGIPQLTDKQERKLLEIWEQRKIKDKMHLNGAKFRAKEPHDIYEMQALYGYQF